MKTLGIMTLNEKSEGQYFTEIAKRAADLGISCYCFIPTNIHPVTHQVTGSLFNSFTNQWRESEFVIPNVIYDRCFYGDDTLSNQCASIVSWLKNKEDIYFLGYGLPNKLELYNVLKQSSLGPYIPQTKQATSASQILNELKANYRIVLKPINGSQGNGIFFLEYRPRLFTAKTYNRKHHIQKEFTDEQKFSTWMNNLISGKNYLMQPYLELTNENNEPFDIRTLLQKNEIGNWTERGRGIRIGHPDGILSNLHAGGRTENYEWWTERLSIKQKEFIKTELNDILSKIPTLLEDAFLPLFELGVDIGMAKNGSIWILDLNSKPGRKVTLETTPDKQDDLYFAPILYGKKLANSVMNERKKYDAKTLSN